uniref:Uncharacterized protein n=1 Tax=Tetranychus urticae TaxID=32264 RepID=T1L3L5_TETUR
MDEENEGQREFLFKNNINFFHAYFSIQFRFLSQVNFFCFHSLLYQFNTLFIIIHLE